MKAHQEGHRSIQEPHLSRREYGYKDVVPVEGKQ